jgi:phosphotransferase system HPr-like phosphotransfer protein
MTAETSNRRAVVVGSRVGMHARPAALVAQAAAEQPVIVRIAKDGDPVEPAACSRSSPWARGRATR